MLVCPLDGLLIQLMPVGFTEEIVKLPATCKNFCNLQITMR